MLLLKYGLLTGAVGCFVAAATFIVWQVVSAVPLVHRVETFSIRDQLFTTNPVEVAKDPSTVLKVYSKEGLPVGLGVSVRYRLDPQRLAYVQSNLPQPVESEIMPPVVANAFRQTISSYMVRDVFSAKREEVRRVAAETITKRLAADGIVVKEVMLRDVSLPPEYAKGLEGLLVKAQENDRLSIELEVKQKMVRSAELEAEAEKMRRVKEAEGRAQVTVLELSQADAQRVRLMASADAERLKSEALVLKENPMVIQKIIAERLSDKVQIMMVPMDGKFFFTNDVLKSTAIGGLGAHAPEQR